MIYLDNAATTPCSKEVTDAMIPFFQQRFGNPESPHEAGEELRDSLFNARKNVAALFGDTGYSHVVFTSGGTEANNLAILGMEKRLLASGKTHMITSSTEHKSVLEAFRRLETRGFQVTYLSPERSGVITLEQVKRAMRPNTGLVSIMYVNNETGCVNQSAAIGMYLEGRPGVFYHIDCVQAAGCYEINHRFLKADMLTVSAHKIHGPKGIGCLWVRDVTVLSPILCGGEQEMFLRPGTQNVPGIIGFGKAAEKFAEPDALFACAKHIRECESLFYRSLSSRINGVYRNFAQIHTCPKVASYRIKDVDAETLAAALSIRGVCVSTGAACNSSSSEPSYVLLASGLSFQEAASTIRVSFSQMTTSEEIERAVSIIADTVAFLRGRNEAA